MRYAEWDAARRRERITWRDLAETAAYVVAFILVLAWAAWGQR